MYNNMYKLPCNMQCKKCNSFVVSSKASSGIEGHHCQQWLAERRRRSPFIKGLTKRFGGRGPFPCHCSLWPSTPVEVGIRGTESVNFHDAPGESFNWWNPFFPLNFGYTTFCLMEFKCDCLVRAKVALTWKGPSSSKPFCKSFAEWHLSVISNW